VDHQPIAEWLPERYRNVLDRISELEAGGRHADADRIRSAAIRVYSRRWNVGTAARLDALASDAQRILTTPVQAPHHWPIVAFLERRSRSVSGAGFSPERPAA
jgi:hypothetical protein